MITFSNLRADESLTFTLPERAAAALLAALTEAGREIALSRWEQELVAWLADRRWAVAAGHRAGVDLGEVAWTPERFPEQQRFVLAMCERALARATDDAVRAAIVGVRDLTAAHGREHVPVGRRWRWLAGRPALVSGMFPDAMLPHKPQ